MAFLIANLCPIGGQSRKGKAPMVWSYRTTDASTTMDDAGYFNAAATLLQVGDLIYAVDVDDVDAPTAITTASLYVVNSNASGVVDVTDATALTVTDVG